MMNPYHLKYFYDTCQNRSLSKAADINYISHSAVSQAIKSLESQLSVKLLYHAKRKFELTAEGQLLFQNSKELFDNFEKLIYSIQPSRVLTGELRVGVSHSIAMGLIDKALSSFCKNHPLIRLKLHIGNSTSLETLLNSRQIDIGFGIEDGNFVTNERQEVGAGKFILIAVKNCKNKDHFLVGDKGREVLVLRKFLKDKLPNARFSEIQSWSILVNLAEEGTGVALVPDFLIKRGSHKLTRAYRQFTLPSYKLSAFYRSKEYLSPTSQKFLQHMQLSTKKK